MKQIILALTLGISGLSTNAFALVGGPFDMGTHGAGLDRNSVYQAVLSFNNGSGFAYFNPTARLVPPAGAAASDFDSQGSIQNRTVLYYKGVTYVGACIGTADPEARFVEAAINASSEVGFSASSTTTGSTNNAASINAAVVSASVVSSGKGFIVNGNFLGKIYQTAPTLRFKGKGELAFVSPTGSSSINTLAYQSYSGLIGAIISFVGNSTVTGAAGINYATVFGGAQTAINSALADLKTNYLATGGVDDSYNEATIEKLRVSGTRRYL